MSTDIVAELRARIAVLETQLEYAQREAQESANSVRFLLNVQASQAVVSSRYGDAEIHGLRQQIHGLQLDNTNLRDQISSNIASLLDTPSSFSIGPGPVFEIASPENNLTVRHTAPSDTLIDLAEPPHAPEPTTVEHNGNTGEVSQESVGFQSMMEGTEEWADGDAMSVTVDRAPVRPRTALPALALPDSIYNPRRAIDRYTGRPAHARDEHWIRWTPNSEKWQKSHRVVIDGLPSSTTYHELLSQVCGGLVISCQIVDTKNITGSMTALIRFHDIDDSCNFVQYAKNYPLLFFDSSSVQVPATVKLATSPSFPLTAKRLDAIRKFGHTRCIEIRNFPLAINTPEAIDDLRWFLRPFAACDVNFIEHIEAKTANSITIAFTSIDAATDAFGLFTGNPTYRSCLVRFVSDPCNRPAKPLFELSEKVNPNEIDVFVDNEDSCTPENGMLTPPDSSDCGEYKTDKMERSLPHRWDGARERELELAALRGSPGCRD